MAGRLYDATFGKQDKANPIRSLAGCLTATAGMVAVTSAALYVYPLVFESPRARMAEAEETIALIAEALDSAAAAAGHANPWEALPEDARTITDPAEYEAAHTEEARTLLGEDAALLDRDPWGQPYRVWFGPLPEAMLAEGPMPLRVRFSESLPEDERTRTLPDGRRASFPAPTDLPVYIYSTGRNRKVNQAHAPDYPRFLPEHAGGGDDINNWDPGRGWSAFYE